MASTASLLKAISFMRDPIRPPCLKQHPRWQIFPTIMRLLPPIKNIKTSTKAAKLRVKCLTNYWSNNCGAAAESVEERHQTCLFEVGRVVNVILKRLSALKKPAVATIVLCALLLSCEALAAPGGRIGGRAVSSSHSSYSCSSSSSWTCSRCKSITNEINGSDDYDDPEYYPTLLDNPTVCLIVTMYVSIVLFARFAWCYHFDYIKGNASALTDPVVTLVMLQVGVLGTGAKSLLREFHRMGKTVDMSTSEGLSYLLKETTLALLQHEDSCVRFHSVVDVKENIKVAEKHFNQFYIEEGRMFDEETDVYVNYMQTQSTITKKKANGFCKEYKITILLAVEGVRKLPLINSRADLKKALQKLGSIPSRKTKAVKVLWAPRGGK